MRRETYVWCPVAGAVVEKWRAAAYHGNNGGPSLLDKPHVWGTMPPTEHLADGKVYDSRERYNRVTRQHGGEEIGKAELRRWIERGHQPVQTGPTIEQSIRQAIAKTGL